MRTVGDWVIAHKNRDAAATQSGVDDERKWTNALPRPWYVLQTEQSAALCGIGEPQALQFFVVAIDQSRRSIYQFHLSIQPQKEK